ncbi:MAG: thioredoxin reductase [Rhizobiales bacterium 32-66-8]|nr:MAG: thioredoxin reductase [Rhizobiales bacterium 32-66-8]
MPSAVDCLIVGAGPAGLTAAIYIARYHLSVQVIESGASRAALIPCSHNHAGFPHGISGPDLLTKMRQQAESFGVSITRGVVERLERSAGAFIVATDSGALRARSVLLATGVTNRRPQMDDTLHAEALRRGHLRYCPVCDGYEVTDQTLAVIGSNERAINEARFLRGFSADVTLVGNDAGAPDEKQHAALAAMGVRWIGGPARDFRLEADGLSFACSAGRLTFDAVYPALGSVIHSQLAVNLGAAATAEGCIKVDSHQRTDVPGLYAAGDVVIGLDQISNAMGQAGIAATTIRNDIAKDTPLLRALRPPLRNS